MENNAENKAFYAKEYKRLQSAAEEEAVLAACNEGYEEYNQMMQEQEAQIVLPTQTKRILVPVPQFMPSEEDMQMQAPQQPQRPRQSFREVLAQVVQAQPLQSAANTSSGPLEISRQAPPPRMKITEQAVTPRRSMPVIAPMRMRSGPRIEPKLNRQVKHGWF